MTCEQIINNIMFIQRYFLISILFVIKINKRISQKHIAELSKKYKNYIVVNALNQYISLDCLIVIYIVEKNHNRYVFVKNKLIVNAFVLLIKIMLF